MPVDSIQPCSKAYIFRLASGPSFYAYPFSSHSPYMWLVKPLNQSIGAGETLFPLLVYLPIAVGCTALSVRGILTVHSLKQPQHNQSTGISIIMV